MKTIQFAPEQCSEERFDQLRATLRELGVLWNQIMLSSNETNLEDSELNPISIMELNEITITII